MLIFRTSKWLNLWPPKHPAWDLRVFLSSIVYQDLHLEFIITLGQKLSRIHCHHQILASGQRVPCRLLSSWEGTGVRCSVIKVSGAQILTQCPVASREVAVVAMVPRILRTSHKNAFGHGPATGSCCTLYSSAVTVRGCGERCWQL